MSSEKDFVEDPASLVKDSELVPPVNNHSLSLPQPQPQSATSSSFPQSNDHQVQNANPQSNTHTNPITGLIRKQTWVSLLTPEKKLSQSNPTYKQSFDAIIRSSWLNLLLVFIPISWALHFATPNQDAAIFTTCMLAIIPLAKLLGFGTEEIAMRVGQTLGGLLNATLGNAVELIVAILALVKCELVVVQSSLLGSILSNLLLVLGMCFFAGGVRFSEQAFSITAAQLNSSLLIMSVIAILIPAGFHAAFSNLNDSVEGPDVLKMSRGISVILLVIYAAYLVFQLWSHAHIYSQTSTSSQEHQGHTTWTGHKILRPSNSVRAQQAFNMVRNSAEGSSHPEPIEEEEEEEEVPTLNPISAIILLALSTALVGVTSEWLVDSINGITRTGVISEAWVGLILLPIVGNAAEHLTAVSVSVKDKLDLSMAVAVGSSIQIALFVVPLLVILGWIMDKPLTLLFDPFESITLFLSVLIVNYTIQDGRANWIEGFILMCVYVIVAVAFFFYPSSAADISLGLKCN
ncbi:hypothetical protein MJO28_013513 [Puccinia striiformis f. sp. tritici]|uniref:Uncharacterized protein n=1 Tax=Puccinia striiformis f. sp. tritici TaxID=168172 RepID=A0ACC0DUR8_9BASI|nr:hypothetical protein Pst134EA_025984 [Puccinia striiformis f. sp. tritici]KAH9452048.1 hypothetical protein Pst134EA_025984 [Puccinia striiformis f. sp. tritici]KAI7939861.1 hypothetical protein MJO28_013513 [Puccinia striiformis f. sp. tritici]KAI7941235.1 hypothetical protein MJO29_013309 [Puccinia striiformis f. sp. tritici]